MGNAPTSEAPLLPIPNIGIGPCTYGDVYTMSSCDLAGDAHDAGGYRNGRMVRLGAGRAGQASGLAGMHAVPLPI